MRAVCHVLFLLALVLFVAAFDTQAQSIKGTGAGGFSRNSPASCGSFASAPKQQSHQMQQNVKQDQWRREEQSRQNQYAMKQDDWQRDQQARKTQHVADQEQWRQQQQQASQAYISDYDDYNN
jgi:hypothetical protein